MQTELVANAREETGKKAAKRMRHEGRILAVLYGHGFETIPISLDEKTFNSLIRHEGMRGLFKLKLEGAKESDHTVVVKEVQRHPLKDYILHIDFQKIRSDEELHTEVALHFLGEPPGVKEGGILQHYLYSITVQCLPKDLPEYIEVDISNLELKDNIRVGDLVQLEAVKYVNNPEEIVTAVAPKRVKEEVAEEELYEEGAPEEGAPEAPAEGEESAAPSKEEA
jgi:large subunit ribosomal protein L25